jgi:heme-degrading monooxygenase HmoA
MYIAMNRFKVEPGLAKEFEQLWVARDVHLHKEPGFITFHLLRGPEREDHVLYSSHTVWSSFSDFEAWTKSESFRKSHSSAGTTRKLYLGHPEFEGFEVIQEVRADGSKTVLSAAVE